MTRTWYDPKPGTTGDIRDRKGWEIQLLNGKPADDDAHSDRIDAAHAALHLTASGLGWLIPVRLTIWRDATAGLDVAQGTDVAARLTAARILHLATGEQMAPLTRRERAGREALRLAAAWMPDAHHENHGVKKVRPELLYAGAIAGHLRDRGFANATDLVRRNRSFIQRADAYDAPVPDIASKLLRDAL